MKRKHQFFTRTLIYASLSIAVTGSAMAQNKPSTSPPAAMKKGILPVSGTVKDRLGKPMDNVSVKITGAPKGTVTDNKGHFELSVESGSSLEFSHIGYKTQLIPITTSFVLDIILDAVEGDVNEVVVVGFGQQKKASLVGAQSTVNMDELRQPTANVSTALAGRIAGVIGVQRSGEPGRDGADIWIRGISTFNASNDAKPLVLIDGVERDINSLDPQDMQSFSILKDASATAVYGVRGANGVVLIKTKSGRPGKTQFNFDVNQGFTAFTKVPELTDGLAYMKLTNEAMLASGQTGRFTQAYIDSTAAGKSPLVFPNVNWLDAVFNKGGTNRRVNVSARGGSTSANYYVSLSYYDENGLLKTDGLSTYNSSTKFRRYNFTSNLNLTLTPTTKAELGIQGYVSNVNYPGGVANNADGTPSRTPNTDAFTQALQITPVAFPVMYPGGFVPGISSNGDQRNPYADITQTGYQNGFNNQLFSNIRLTQDLAFIVKGLTATTMFSVDAYNQQYVFRRKRPDTYFVNQTTPYNPDGSLNIQKTFSGSNTLGFQNYNAGNRRFYTETSVNYDQDFGQHHVSGMLLYSQSDYTDASATNLTASLPFRFRGLAGRGTYSWMNKYFAEFNFGYNGSENFEPNKRYGFFPSFGLGWIVSEEKFFKPFENVFQFFKIRYSDGLVGSGTGGTRFGYLTFVNNNTSGYTFGTTRIGVAGTNISNYGSDITWATAHKRDLGVELKTFHGDISLIVDLFQERRTGVFLQRGSMAGFVGLTSTPWGNLGIIENKGIDLTLETRAIKLGKNATIQFRGNFTYNKDKVIENDQAVNPLYPWLDRRGSNYLSRWGYVATGLFTDAEIADPKVAKGSWAVRAGDIKYQDTNGDGKIDANDQVRIGRGDVPAMVYGFGFNATLGNFYAGAFFQGVSQADRMLSGDAIIPFNNSTGADRSNLFAIANDRWTVDNPNPNAFYPRLGYGSAVNQNNSQTSTWWLKDISFIRLKTAELGYILPQKTLQRLGVKSSRIYIQGVNLLTFSNFKLWDPELNTNNGTAYPNIRTISVGFQATL